MSFAYRNGLPREADLVFDVRFLNNPHYVEALRPRPAGPRRCRNISGPIRRSAPFVADLQGLLLPLLPRYRTKGKSYLTIAFGCTGGRHRSVFLAELMTRLAARCWLGGDYSAPRPDPRGRCRREAGRRMIGLVLVTHGRLAAEFLAAMEHVVGPQAMVARSASAPTTTSSSGAARSSRRSGRWTTAAAWWC